MSANAFLPEKAVDLVERLGLIPHPEGGFFLETFRSGSIPMSSQGQTNYNVSERKDLVTTTGRERARPDGNCQRNALTSIYWCPTLKSPIQPLVQNDSDHVHYYQGGLPFEYFVYDTESKELQSFILGPDITHGHVLQFPVRGERSWKCGRILASYNDTVTDATRKIAADYSLIAEAVGPGFDFHDFRFVQEIDVDQILGQSEDTSVRNLLKSFLQRKQTMEEISEHYTEKDVQQSLKEQRI